MAAGATALLTWFGSSTSIRALLVPLVRGHLTRRLCAFTRGGEVRFTACAVVVSAQGSCGDQPELKLLV